MASSDTIQERNSDMNSGSDSLILVSVIVPVYHAKKYLPELLNSLRNQTMQGMEFIFINDKGGDGSFRMVKEAAKSDSRIVCLENKVNKGPGFSRNKGIKKARGEYIAFADADDLMAADFYELLYRKAKEGNYLVVKGERCKLLPDGGIEKSPLNEAIQNRMKGVETPLCLFTYEHQSAIFSRKLVLDTKAKNAENARYDEDTCFLMMVLKEVLVSQFALECNAKYYYRQHSDSLVQQKRDEFFLQQSNNSAKFKIDYLLKRPASTDSSRYLASTFEERLGSRLDAAVKDGISDETAHEYIQVLAEKLRDWRNSTTVACTPGTLSAALENVNYRADHFYIQRGAYRKIAQTEGKLNVIRRDLDAARRDIATCNQTCTSAINEIRSSLKSGEAKLAAHHHEIKVWQAKLEEKVCLPLAIIETVLEKLCRFRLEICHNSSSEHSFELAGADELSVSSPEWLCRNGYEKLLQGKTGTYSLQVKAKESGLLKISLRGVDVRGKDGRVPAWVDVTSLQINGEGHAYREVWHDKPFRTQLDVEPEQLITIDVTTQPHFHSLQELEQLLKACYPEMVWDSLSGKALLGELQNRIASMRGISLPQLYKISQKQKSEAEALQRQSKTLLQKLEQLATSIELFDRTMADMDKTISELTNVTRLQAGNLSQQSSRLQQAEQKLMETQQKLTAESEKLGKTEQTLTETLQKLTAESERLGKTEQTLTETLQKLTAESEKLGKTEKTLTETRQSLSEQKNKQKRTEQELVATQKKLEEVQRFSQLNALMPRLWWQYQFLRLIKTFSFGKKRQHAKNELRKARALIHEYKKAVLNLEI